MLAFQWLHWMSCCTDLTVSKGKLATSFRIRARAQNSRLSKSFPQVCAIGQGCGIANFTFPAKLSTVEHGAAGFLRSVPGEIFKFGRYSRLHFTIRGQVMGRLDADLWLLRGLLLLLLCSFEVHAVRVPLEDNPAIQRFREYLRIPTVHPDPDYAPAVEFLRGQADEIGLNATTFQFVENKPILVITWEGFTPSLPSIMLSSHMDVVPVVLEKWNYDPFAAFMDNDGNIYARGTQDMKGLGMLYLETIRILKQKEFKPVRTIHVVFVPDEEIGGAAGWGSFIESSEFASLNAGIVMDEGRFPSANNTYYVNWAEKSAWWLVIKAEGPTGHGSLMYDNSALENLFKSVESISRFRESQWNLVKAGANFADVVTVNGVFLQAGLPTTTGYTMNVQPTEAEAGFDIRVPPYPEVASALKRRIAEEWAPSARNLSYWFDTKFETDDGSPSVTTIGISNPWWVLLEKSLRNLNGNLTPDICMASTDMRFLRKKGIPAFGFTTIQADPVLIHDHNEFVNGWLWLHGIDVYADVLEEFAMFFETSSPEETPDLHRTVEQQMALSPGGSPPLQS